MKQDAKVGKKTKVVKNQTAGANDVDARYAAYVRSKVNQLLQVMGTLPLRPEELDDRTLLDIDPIGIIAGSFEQILQHLRETNRELTIARDELQAIFDSTGVGISIIDQDFRIIKCNEKQRELLIDKTCGDVTGRYCYEVFCNKDSPGLDCPAVDTLATDRSVIIREVKKKGKHFQIATTPFKDAAGVTTGVIEVLLDITELIQAKDAEQKQRGFYLAEKSKLAAVIESLSDGLFVTGVDDAIVSFNQAAERIAGDDEASVVGRNFREFLAGLAVAPPALPDQPEIANFEMTLRTRTDRPLIISVNSVVLRDAQGEASGKVFTLRDVTDEKQRQEMYYRTEKLAALGQLSAGVAHELNTPLGCILGYARLLMKAPDLRSTERERLGIIAEQAKRGSAIIKGLLNFARRSDPARRELSDTDMNTVVMDMINILALEMEKRHITVSTDFQIIPIIQADKRQMEQVVFNMLLNSLQAIRDNGVIHVQTSSDGASVRLVVKDSGPGIPNEIRTKIFDPFFTTKSVDEGTGLGLSICAGIISDHNGSIEVGGEPGKGAVLTVTMPVNTASCGGEA